MFLFFFLSIFFLLLDKGQLETAISTVGRGER